MRTHLAILMVRFALMVGILASMIGLTVTMLIGTVITKYLIASLALLVAGVYGLKRLNLYTDKQTRRNIDKRFAYSTYFSLIHSLKENGVEEPGVFLATHDRNVDAYKEVKIAAVCAIETELVELHGEADTDEVFERAHEIAMLVFPGEKENARAPRILHLIRERRILDMRSIKELVDATEDKPLPLLDGAL